MAVMAYGSMRLNGMLYTDGKKSNPVRGYTKTRTTTFAPLVSHVGQSPLGPAGVGHFEFLVSSLTMPVHEEQICGAFASSSTQCHFNPITTIRQDKTAKHRQNNVQGLVGAYRRNRPLPTQNPTAIRSVVDHEARRGQLPLPYALPIEFRLSYHPPGPKLKIVASMASVLTTPAHISRLLALLPSRLPGTCS